MSETIDTLQIEIESNASQADAAIESLTSALLGLQQQLGGFNNTSFKQLTGGLKELGIASKELSISNLSSSLKKLSESVLSFSGTKKEISPTIKNLEKLSSFDFSKLKIDGDFSALSSLANGIDSFALAAPKLAAVSPVEINRTTKALEKLGSIDLSKIGSSLQAFNGVVDMSVLENLGNAFQGFAASLSGTEKVPSAISKLFSSLSQLAASAQNIPLVTANLPELSTEIGNFISVLGQSATVQEGTVGLVAALSGISSAGNKAEKTVSALPGLTAGIRDFIAAMTEVPVLDKEIVKVIDSLGQLASAGGKAGTAAGRLQGQIKGLSDSMFSLGSSTKKALSGIKSFSKQILSAMGIGLSLYGAIQGIKKSLDISSDLTEVQNVVDVTFGDMKQKVEDLASTSIQDFGMSELTAKQISSRFQAIGVAMGFTQGQMSDMSVELTKLAGDMASFYNVEQEDVAKSLESIFTGQTVPLRRFGLDLTNASLQAWALAQGMDANVNKMTNAEKAMLRYQYVLANSAAAMGDFSRTSGSWANQLRILSQQFQQLGGIIGNGLIAAFLPVIKVINTIMAKIIQLATIISSFLGKLFGFQQATISTGAGFAGVADAAGLAADNTEAVADGISDAGGAAKKAGKELNKYISAWHEVNSMTSDSDSAAGGGAGGGGTGASLPDITLPSDYTFEINTDDKVTPILEKIKKRFLELTSLFIKGFKLGLGDTSVFDSIISNFQRIKTSLLNIFTDRAVVNSFNEMLDTLTYNAGIKTGAFISIGSSIIDNITAGAASYLESATDRIQSWLIAIFDTSAQSDTIVTNFIAAIGDIFTIFRSDDAKAITSDIIQIFGDGFMGGTELAAKFGRDILALILDPITENSGKFKEAIQNTLKPIEEILGTLADSFTHTWEAINRTYDEHIQPLFGSFTTGISQIVESLLGGYNQHIVPVLDRLSKKFTEVWKGTIDPLLENFIGLFGDVANFIQLTWEKIFQPFINWIASNIMPVIAPVLEAWGNTFLITFELTGNLLDGFITSARGVIEFLHGFFTGNWKEVWEGTKTIFSGIWDAIPDILTTPIETAANGIISFLTNAFAGDWQAAWQSIQDGFKEIWNATPEFVKEPIRAIIGFVNKMIEGIEGGINYVISALNSINLNIPDWVPGIGGESFGFNVSQISLGRIPALSNGGIIRNPTIALLGENGEEAVMPLKNNTQWISNVADDLASTLLKNAPNGYQLDLSLPQIEDYMPTIPDSGFGQYKSAMQMEMDAKMAQESFDIRQQNELLQEQNELLRAILNKPALSDNDVFNATRRGQQNFQRRTNLTGWRGID